MSRRSVAALACVAGALLAVAFTVLSGARDSSPRAAASAAVDPAQRASFAVLDQPAATDLPRELRDAQDVVGKRFRLASSQVRAVRGPDGTRLWVMPGEQHICLAADDAEGIGITCGTTGEARSGKLILVERSTTGGQDAAFGLAPDGAKSASADTRAAASASTSIRDNVFVLRGREIQSVAADGGAALKLP